MKILYVATISNTINAFLIPHIELLIEQGHKVDIACNVVREIDQELIQLGCKVHDIKFQRSPLKKDNYEAYRRIRKLVLDGDYDLVHTHTPIASFLTRMACRNISSLKVLYTAHGFHFLKGAPLKNWIIYYSMEKLAARWTDGIITMNEEDYNMAKKMNMRGKDLVFKVHGVGIDLSRFSSISLIEKNNLRSEYGYSNDDFILFYAAELNYNKHQDILINSVNLLKGKIPNLKLLLAGNGILKEKYEQQIRNLGLEKNVQLLGFRNDILNLLKISDVAVASSRREGLPVNVMEAMATGIPLVVTDCRGQRDLVSDGENGFIVGVDDIEGFANAIVKLYNSIELRQRFGEKGIVLSALYSLDKVIKEIERVYFNYFCLY